MDQAETEEQTMHKFLEIQPEQWNENVFSKIGREWMLVTAGDRQRFNTMTASWGGLGVLWNANVSFAFVRPTRYTYEFMEENREYSLSFLGRGQRQALQICGTQSGRDADKVGRAGLTPCFEERAPYFAEAETVLICRKMYTQDLDPSRFLDPTIASHYAAKDYHRMYIGEIVKVLKRAD